MQFGSLIKRLLLHEEVLIICISLIFLYFSIFPTLNFYFKTPADSVYTFLHNSVSDYPYYISFIRQGISGRTTAIDQFTTEPQTASLIHIFYVGLGTFGKIFPFSPTIIYFLSRIILGIVFLLAGYWFVSFFLKKSWERILAFIFFISSAGFSQTINVEKGFSIQPYLFWWTEIDPLRRITFIPHFLFGHIGFIAILLLLLYLFKTQKPHFLIIATILGLVVGLSHPPSLGMIYYIFGAYLVIGIFSAGIRSFKINLIYFLIFVVLTIPSLLYIYNITNNVFPWTLMKVQESLFYAISLKEYILSFGPIFILGIFGILLSFSKKEFSILTLWIIIDVVMIPLSKIIAFTPLSIKIPTFANIRFLSMSLQLPLAVLSVYFLGFIKNRFNQRLFWITIGAYTILTFIMYPTSWQTQLIDFSQVRQFVYPKKSLVEAFTYLDKNTTADEAVLADADSSLLLPLFAKNKVYFGQSIYTYQNELKRKNTNLFFQGELKDCQSFEFLSEGRISYILISEKQQLEKLKAKKFLSPLFNNNDINIYKFNPDARC